MGFDQQGGKILDKGMSRLAKAGTRPSGGGYWYPEARRPSSVDVLNLLRSYRENEQKMRARTRSSMKMGESDLIALRFLLRAQKAGEIVLQRDIANLLNITSASTTSLVDRLCKSGHVRRIPHPTDRRAVVLEATVETDQEVRETLGVMHARMIEAVDSLSDEDADTVARFLILLNDAIRED